VTVYPADPRPRALVKANVGKAAGVSAAALAIMVAFTARHEGEVRHTYRDPVGVLTYCYGSTAGARLGETYTHAECVAALREDALTHAAGVQTCLPADLPPTTSAAFYDFGYNVGVARFCGSGVSRKATRGDVRGACDDMLKWVYAGGQRLPGLVRRRIEERDLCLQGLKDGR
jgi:lysozyme